MLVFKQKKKKKKNQLKARPSARPAAILRGRATRWSRAGNSNARVASKILPGGSTTVRKGRARL